MALHAHITAFLRRAGDGRPVLEDFRRGVRRLMQTLPVHCFPALIKDDDAYAGLANEVFALCAVKEKGRYPFRQHTPFCHFSRARSSDLDIRRLVFFNRISIAKEMIRSYREHNLLRDPRQQWQAELFKRLATLLAELAEPAPGRDRWRLDQEDGHTHLALVERQLQRWVGEQRVAGREPALAEAVTFVLGLRAPLSRSQLSYTLSAALNPYGDWQPVLEPTPADSPLRLVVRDAVHAAWRDMEPEDKDFLMAVVAGLTAREAATRYPHLNTDDKVTDAIKRCNARFIAKVEAQVQGEVELAAKPRTLADLIYQVLIPMLEVEL